MSSASEWVVGLRSEAALTVIRGDEIPRNLELLGDGLDAEGRAVRRWQFEGEQRAIRGRSEGDGSDPKAIRSQSEGNPKPIRSQPEANLKAMALESKGNLEVITWM